MCEGNAYLYSSGKFPSVFIISMNLFIYLFVGVFVFLGFNGGWPRAVGTGRLAHRAGPPLH